MGPSSGMRILWETYRKRVPLLGVPHTPIDNISLPFHTFESMICFLLVGYVNPSLERIYFQDVTGI